MLPDRFALALFEDGGIVVDTTDGRFFHLNRSAAEICEALATASAPTAALAALARRFGVPTSTIEKHAASLIDDLAHHAGVRLDLPGRFRYGATSRGYDLSHLGQPVLNVSLDGHRLCLLDSMQSARPPMLDCVRAVAPKILALRGITILHGASVRWKGSALGICGVSRAGKTTTARLLAASGRAELISEDLMVLAVDENSGPAVYLPGELRVHRWAADTAAALQTSQSLVETSLLSGAASGDTLPIRSCWFLDAGRRRSDLTDRIELRRLGPTEAATLVLQHAFLGAADSTSWRRHLERVRVLANQIEAYEASVPAKVEDLRVALDNYTVSSAS